MRNGRPLSMNSAPSGQSGEGAGVPDPGAGVDGEAANVELVDNRVLTGDAEVDVVGILDPHPDFCDSSIHYVLGTCQLSMLARAGRTWFQRGK